jgi:hypothetical protein
MKYYTFRRESNNFTDILKDPSLKKKIYNKIKWDEHLMIGVDDIDDKIESYIFLKYGDELQTSLFKDRTPTPGVDYIPSKKPKL